MPFWFAFFCPHIGPWQCFLACLGWYFIILTQQRSEEISSGQIFLSQLLSNRDLVLFGHP